MNDKKMTSATITVLGLLLIGIVMVLLAANAAHKAKIIRHHKSHQRRGTRAARGEFE